MKRTLFLCVFVPLWLLLLPAEAGVSDLVCGVKMDHTWEKVCGMRMEWSYREDPKTGRFVFAGTVGKTRWDIGVSDGVPPYVRIFLERPPDWPWADFCLDTLHIGVKQPAGTPPSLLAVTLLPGHGRPAWAVFSDHPTSKIETLCYSAASPDEHQRWPYVVLQNQWDRTQVISFVLAGEIRP